MAGEPKPGRARAGIARGYALVEDVAYVGLGVLLGATVLSMLAGAAVVFARTIAAGMITADGATALLDEVLLILLIVELLYTVQVSFREHAIVAEPVLLVGLISAIRRVLVLTAELGHLKKDAPPEWMIAELAVLALLIVALAVALMLLRRRDVQSSAGRS